MLDVKLDLNRPEHDRTVTNENIYTSQPSTQTSPRVDPVTLPTHNKKDRGTSESQGEKEILEGYRREVPEGSSHRPERMIIESRDLR